MALQQNRKQNVRGLLLLLAHCSPVVCLAEGNKSSGQRTVFFSTWCCCFIYLGAPTARGEPDSVCEVRLFLSEEFERYTDVCSHRVLAGYPTGICPTRYLPKKCMIYLENMARFGRFGSGTSLIRGERYVAWRLNTLVRVTPHAR